MPFWFPLPRPSSIFSYRACLPFQGSDLRAGNESWIHRALRGGGARIAEAIVITHWDEYFADGTESSRIQERAVYQFVAGLGKCISARPLRIWDLCCGAGRHTVALARLGHEVYASDGSTKAIELTRQWLNHAGISAKIAVAEMTTGLWPDNLLHGVVCWDSLHHDTIDKINQTVAEVYHSLLPRGMFMANVMSVKSMGQHGEGREIETYTFVNEDGHEAGVPHHFFDEDRLRHLLATWEILVLVEQMVSYKERSQKTPRINPFSYSFWGFVVRKPA